MPDDDPQRLVTRAQAGDPAAVEALVARYGPLVRTALHGTLAPDVRARVDTDDLFQSTMSAALADLAKFAWHDEPSFRAWLVTVATRQAAMAGRFHRRDGRDPGREAGPDAAAFVAAAQTTPSGVAVRREGRVALVGAVARLEPAARQVVTLRSFQGLSFEEVARLSGLADADAARYVFRRAIRELGELLDAAE